MQSLNPTQKEIDSTAIPDSPWHRELVARMGAGFVRERLARERLLLLNMEPMFRHPDGLADRRFPVRALSAFLRGFFLANRAQKNFKTISVQEKEWHLPHLPWEMDGFRLLQVSDMHLDFDPAVLDRLEVLLRGVEYDVACLTGDFYDLVFEEDSMDLSLLDRFASLFPGPKYGVLGNHDILSVARELETRGVRVLMNESEWIGPEGRGLLLAGVDDPRQYQTDSIERAVSAAGEDSAVVLLAHSPQVFREAAASGVGLMLSGHTHGGQVSLPGGIPLTNRFEVPGAMVSGEWRHEELQGYTSNGCCGCKLPYRLNAPADITVHRLRC